MAFEGERLARRFGVPVDDCNLLLEGIMFQMLERGETANDFEACVEQLIKEATAEIGEKISVRRFVKYNLGEGIEKKEEDFAAEVEATRTAS